MNESYDRRAEPRAGIIVTGTEVLNGTIADRHGPWLSQRLAELGFEVAQIVVTGDRPADMEAALDLMSRSSIDLIITTGGLGPTADDRTAEAVAHFAGLRLKLDRELEQRIAAILARYARNRPELDPDAVLAANRKQALVPEGAVALDPVGTAPGLIVPAPGRTLVLVLPGPPRELQAMWEDAIARPPLAELIARATPIGHRVLRLYDVPESAIATTLSEIEDEHGELAKLEVTTCLRRGELEVEVRHRTGGDAEAQLAALIEGIDRRHGDRVFSHDGATIDDQLAGLLRGHRLAVGESCTAGLLAARIADRPGSSAYFAGGVVAYSNEAKSQLLGVPEELIERHGAVSPEVAAGLANGAIARFDADLGAGITGIAGPDGGSEAKPVGLVCLCVADRSGPVAEREVVIPGGRRDIRERAALAAMHMLRQSLARP